MIGGTRHHKKGIDFNKSEKSKFNNVKENFCFSLFHYFHKMTFSCWRLILKILPFSYNKERNLSKNCYEIFRQKQASRMILKPLLILDLFH